MTLKQKREIVRAFRKDHGIDGCTLLVWNLGKGYDLKECRYRAEQVLRDFINGKFKLKDQSK